MWPTGWGGLLTSARLRSWCIFSIIGSKNTVGRFLVAQDLSKSVECEAGEIAEFVQQLVGALLAEGEEGAVDWPATRLSSTWI